MPHVSEEEYLHYRFSPPKFDPNHANFKAYMAVLEAQKRRRAALEAYEAAVRDLIQAEADFEYIKTISRKTH